MGIFGEKSDRGMSAGGPPLGGLAERSGSGGAPRSVTGADEALGRGERQLWGPMWLWLVGSQLIFALIVAIGARQWYSLLGKEHTLAANLLAFTLPGIAFAAIGLFFVMRDEKLRGRRARLARSISTTADVAAVDISGIRGDAGYKEEVAVCFLDAGGSRHQTQLQLPKSGLDVGQQLAVRYDPRDPAWAVAEGWDPIGLRVIILFVGAMLLVPLVLLIWALAMVAG